jgi:hypothetical protein
MSFGYQDRATIAPLPFNRAESFVLSVSVLEIVHSPLPRPEGNR